MKSVVTVCILASFGVPGTAMAADPFYLGSWTITTAVVAPWADPHRKPDDSERTRLMGKTLTIRAKEVSGPRSLACAKPQYKMTDYGPEMIFQGAFDEMQRAGKKADPKALATSLGFAGGKIKTLETGCEIDFHFVDDTTAEIGLNNYVYTLKRQYAAPGESLDRSAIALAQIEAICRHCDPWLCSYSDKNRSAPAAPTSIDQGGVYVDAAS